jgi:uncharacterized membrane protein YeaQ/YmgE (transglycosylase-associated protein family)
MDAGVMNLIIFLLIGLAAGYVAGLIIKGRPFGLLGDMLLGVVGAFVGGWLLGALGVIVPGGIIGSFVVALLGAVLILFVVRLIKKA